MASHFLPSLLQLPFGLAPDGCRCDTPGADPYLEELVKNADRVFYFDEGPRAEARIIAEAVPRTQRIEMKISLI